MKKTFTRETVTGAIVILLSVLGIVLFALGFSTGYYIYGQMNSTLITLTAVGAIVLECAAIFCLNKFQSAWWPKLLTFGVTALLAFAAMTLIGDRVEGIGNCILTDYDSGHGGEEAIYLSLGGAIAWLVAMVFNMIGAFGKDAADDRDAKPAKAWTLAGVGVVALIAVLIPSLILGGIFAPKSAPAASGNATAQNGGAAADPSAVAGTYTVKLSGAEGNVEKVQDYQFQCGNLSGLMNYDTRLTLDLALTLNADGTYSLFSDGYAFEAGKRAVIGDDTGLGMISQMTAEGTYTVNEDGTVTTSQASHAVFELQLDTYSSQMRGPANYKLGEDEMADGKYDSAEYPVILESVPEAVWTLNGDMTIAAYAIPSDEEPAEQPAEEPAAEAAPAAEGVVIPSDDGGTTMTFNPDGTFAFDFASYSIHEEGTYTFEGGKLTVVNANGAEAVGEGDPIKLHYVSATSEQLTGDYTIPASTFDFAAAEAAPVAGVEIASDDGATALTFNPDGTFAFDFASYSIHEEGTYTFEGGKLTVVNANGLEAAGEGDPIKLHYVSATSEQLTGDYTIPASTFDFAAAEAPAASFAEFTIPSDDEGTKMTFRPDGTYRFDFESYSIVDEGTFTYENGVLTLTDVNGVQYTGEGDPIKLHYGYSGAPDQLTGEYTIDAALFGSSEPATPAAEPVTVTSVDGGTTITFNGDGTYRFFFEAYNVEDPGTYTMENGVLTVTNANGLAMTPENGVLHYISSVSDMLTGDFAIGADLLG